MGVAELADALDSAAANCHYQRVSGLSFRHPQVFYDVFCVAFSLRRLVLHRLVGLLKSWRNWDWLFECPTLLAVVLVCEPQACYLQRLRLPGNHDFPDLQVYVCAGDACGLDSRLFSHLH